MIYVNPNEGLHYNGDPRNMSTNPVYYLILREVYTSFCHFNCYFDCLLLESFQNQSKQCYRYNTITVCEVYLRINNTVNFQKFRTLYSILFWLKFCFLCSSFFKYLVEWQTV